MDMSIAKDVIRVIRAEGDRRSVQLEEEDPEFGYNPWPGSDEMFINELCLMLLVAIRHHVERELLGFAARADSDRRVLGAKEYRQRVEEEREELKKKGSRKGWERISSKLGLTDLPEWKTTLETLRLLSNSYKHHPSMTPDENLLKHLCLDAGGNYATLPESPDLRKGLAASLGLQGDSDYCDIVEEFLGRVGRFLSDVQAQSMLSPVKRWESAESMDPATFLR